MHLPPGFTLVIIYILLSVICYLNFAAIYYDKGYFGAAEVTLFTFLIFFENMEKIGGLLYNSFVFNCF